MSRASRVCCCCHCIYLVLLLNVSVTWDLCLVSVNCGLVDLWTCGLVRVNCGLVRFACLVTVHAISVFQTQRETEHKANKHFTSLVHSTTHYRIHSDLKRVE